jgi:ATP-dependent Lhr-like helicase
MQPGVLKLQSDFFRCFNRKVYMNKSEVLNIFHPAVKEWFLNNIGKPSPPQIEGWPQIQSGKNVLISAPTGAGKTLAAFLESINRLLEMGLKKELPEGVFILYVSPLKALNNDINKNLEIPFQGIRQLFTEKGEAFPDIRKAVRTGDTSQYERTQILKNPPHILITTPESLFLMLHSYAS